MNAVAQHLYTLILEELLATTIDMHTRRTHQHIAPKIAENSQPNLYRDRFLAGMQLRIAGMLYDNIRKTDLTGASIKKPLQVVTDAPNIQSHRNANAM
jgi:hypothetical protein